jgi:hypothetical protein
MRLARGESYFRLLALMAEATRPTGDFPAHGAVQRRGRHPAGGRLPGLLLAPDTSVIRTQGDRVRD